MNSSVNLTADAIDVPALASALAETPFAGRVHHFGEIVSTNTYAMQAGAEGAPDGSVYVADAQSGGRGRGAHTWSSPPGSGLYVSVLLRPKLLPGDALWLSLAGGVAAQDAVRAVAGFVPDLRWPNDLLVGRRKLGGVLTEMQAEVTRVRFVVIGIGINVHQQSFPPELADRATSLAIEEPKKKLSRQGLLISLLQTLHTQVHALVGRNAEAGQQALLARLEAGSTWMRGKSVTVGEEPSFSGVSEGLDPRGFLRVRTDAGELRTVLSGAVRERE